MAYPQPRTAHAARQRTVLLPVVGLLALGVCALIVIGIVGSTVGPAAAIVGSLCALLPVVPVVATFLWIDRWEPEPPRVLLVAFLWGAGVAALSALVINSGAMFAVDEMLGRGAADVVGATIVAPFVEEAMKGMLLVGLLVFRRREFDGIVDGIVYAGLVAAGFAFTENILYFGRAFAEDGIAGQSSGVIAVFFLRGVISPFAHPLFTSMTGIGAGIAAGQRSPVVRVLAVVTGYLVAVLLHGLWNGSATLGGGEGFLGVYVFVMVPLFLSLVGVVIWQRRREARIVIAQLPGFAQAGLIAWSEVPLLGNLAKRRGWRSAVRRRTGKAAARAVGDYQAAVTELAFLRDRIHRGAVQESAGRKHEEMLRTLAAARARAIGMPDALTATWRNRIPQGWTPPPPEPVPTHGYGPPPGYGAAPGHGAAPGRAGAPGYGAPPGYGPAPGYGPGQGHRPPPGYGSPPHPAPPPGGWGAPGSGNGNQGGPWGPGRG